MAKKPKTSKKTAGGNDTHVYLSDDLKQRIKDEAKAENRSLAGQIRHILERHCKEQRHA